MDAWSTAAAPPLSSDDLYTRLEADDVSPQLRAQSLLAGDPR